MHQNTTVINSGRHPEKHHGNVNPPIYQTSTILFPTLKAYHDAELGKSCYAEDGISPVTDASYAITGTPTTFALSDALAELEGGEHTLLVPSGLAAVTVTLMSLVKPGDHILMTDSVYGPSRRFCTKELHRLGIKTTFYDPLIGSDIRHMMQDNTTIVFVESPGSMTFEMQDIPAIAKEAHARGAIVIMDNSWATPLYYKPFEHGVDISLQAITKFIGGHSDVIMGGITTSEKYFKRIYSYFRNTGLFVSPHDCYLAQRGLRSLATRMKQHQETGLILANWLKGRKEIARILYPALPGDPGHDLWKRDFTGAAGLFSFILHPCSDEAVAEMINPMELFGIGCSWGGYESLIIQFDPSSIRTASKWKAEGPCIRIHAGLEDPDDLIRDLENGLARLAA